MYPRIIKRKNKDGSEVKYAQLCENKWNREKKRSEVKIIYNLGRIDRIDYERIVRAIKSLETFLPEKDRRYTKEENLPISAKQFGMLYLLEEVWKSLSIDKTIKALLRKRRYSLPVERVILSEVMNRAILPHSKKGTYEWIEEDTYFKGKEKISLQHMYRAMDFLIRNKDEIENDVYLLVSNLFNREPFIVFYDTTTTYFEIDREDHLRKRGHSKDKRFDKPQIVLAVAINRDGYPIKHWVFPGNTAEKTKIQFVMKEVRKIKGLLFRGNENKNDSIPLIWISDNGMMKRTAIQYLEENNEKYIIAGSLKTRIGEELLEEEKDSKEGNENKSKEETEEHSMCYRTITLWNGKKLLVRERVIDNRRYILCYSKEQEEKDRKAREEIIECIREKMKGIKNKIDTKKILSLYTHRMYGKYLIKNKETKEIEINETRIEYDAKRDGKFLLVTNDLTSDAKDIVSGYKSLYTVERAFETMKSVLDLRPVCHSREDRIKAHAFLCILAYLLVHHIEVKTNSTYGRVKEEIEKLSAVEYKTREGITIIQRTQLTNKQREIFNKLKIKTPPMYLYIGSEENK